MHRVRKDVLGNVKLEVKLETTLDVILNIIKLEDSKEQGRRYGHPVIDIVRELNRYMHPQIHYAGKTKEAIEKVFAQKLKDALGIDEK